MARPAETEPFPQFNMHEAKTHFSRLVERVEQGEQIVISRAGRPVARLVPLERLVRGSRGSLRGLVTLSPDWDSPEVNDAIADDFGA